MKRIMFVTWDGPQVTYLEGLFVPIFARLKKRGFEFAVLQFTYGERSRSDQAHAACEAAGIPYRRVDIWRAGPAGAFVTSALGGRHVDQAVREWRIDMLMPRGLLPALAVLRSRSGRRLPIVFDADGLPADERVEFAGLNRCGAVYWVLRRIEAAAVRHARAVLVRTQATISILADRAAVASDKFHVVTNGRDPAPFLTLKFPEPGGRSPKLCYLGSIGPQYLPERTFALAAEIRSRFPGTTLSIFTGDREAAAAALSAVGLREQDWISTQSLNPSEVPQALAACDIGFALRQQSFSMQGVAPVKIGDYLLAGLPIIGTGEVGPVAEALRSGCMVAADRPLGELLAWIGAVLDQRETWRGRCRDLGLRQFSIDHSVEQYRGALEAAPRPVGN